MQVRPLSWWLCCILKFSFLKGRLRMRYPPSDHSIIHYFLSSSSPYLWQAPVDTIKALSLLKGKISKIKFAKAYFEWVTEQLAIPRFDLNDNIFFKLEYILKYLASACYAHLTDSWSFWSFEWIPLSAFSFQQYIIGTHELHILPFSRESVVSGRPHRSVLLFSWWALYYAVALSLPSSLGYLLRYWMLGCLVGKFLLHVLRHSPPLCVLFILYLGEKISESNSFLFLPTLLALGKRMVPTMTM